MRSTVLLVLGGLAFLTAGCCFKSKHPETITIKQQECLTTPPPELIPWTPSTEGCPAPYVACLTATDANALATSYERLVNYARNAWTLCGRK